MSLVLCELSYKVFLIYRMPYTLLLLVSVFPQLEIRLKCIVMLIYLFSIKVKGG